MPECVASWVARKDPKKIGQIQRELVQIYEHAIRFSKMGYVKNGMITNIPLYLARKLPSLLLINNVFLQKRETRRSLHSTTYRKKFYSVFIFS